MVPAGSTRSLVPSCSTEIAPLAIVLGKNWANRFQVLTYAAWARFLGHRLPLKGLTNLETMGLTSLETQASMSHVRELGAYLRELRLRKRKSLKQAAPDLDLSASYLSKLENGKLVPPTETTEKLARYYGVDPESMNAMAGRLPDDVVTILQGNPDEAIRLLREKFGGRR